MSVKRLYSRSIYSPWKLSLAYFLSPPRRRSPPFAGRRILLCNMGGLGDVFLLTQMLPGLSDSKVGFLVTKEGKAAVERCPGAEQVHLIEPWYRFSDSKLQKWKRWRAFCMEAKTRKEEFASYDTVLFSSPHFFGWTRLFPDAYTIGFDSHADRFRYSKVIPFNPQIYLTQVYGEVLEALGYDPSSLATPWKELVQKPFLRGRYCVMHIGGSEKSKEFSAKMWREVYDGLKAEGHRIVFTGKGQRALIEEICSDPEENFSDRLSWLEFLRVIAHSDLVLSVDTVALHVAAAMNRPLIALYRNRPGNATWQPSRGLS